MKVGSRGVGRPQREPEGALNMRRGESLPVRTGDRVARQATGAGDGERDAGRVTEIEEEGGEGTRERGRRGGGERHEGRRGPPVGRFGPPR